MKLNEKISLEEVCGLTFKIRVVEATEYGKAAFTHYLHNHQNGISKFYKKEAIQHVKRALEYKFPNEDITTKVAEEALQYMIFDFKKEASLAKLPKSKQKQLFQMDDAFSIKLSGRASRYNLSPKKQHK